MCMLARVVNVSTEVYIKKMAEEEKTQSENEWMRHYIYFRSFFAEHNVYISSFATVSHSHFATMRNENVVVAQSNWIQQCRLSDDEERTYEWLTIAPGCVCMCVLRREFLFTTTVNSVKRHSAWLYVLCAWRSFSGRFIHRSEYRSIVCARLWLPDMVSHRFRFVIWIHTHSKHSLDAHVRIFHAKIT